MIAHSEPYSLPLFNSEKIIEKYGSIGVVANFLEEIQATNARFNLVSRETTYPDLIQMAADSLIPFEFIEPPAGKIFDIGPGAGFPSLIILLSFPGVEGVLFERTLKKAGFLAGIMRKFGLKGKIIPEDFLEAIKKIPSSEFNYGFMKYVRPDQRLLQGAQSLLLPHGQFIYYSKFAPPSNNKTGLHKCRTHEYYLDNSDRVRTICVFSK
ncbi:hypothetical protein TRIP_C10020 [Candidatus Zixiibacteriota bacterium]|nr:hypothetical protein TRIP_C10020 [candidate division Zixibacteria bacterium]